jgi:hypothetical protein
MAQNSESSVEKLLLYLKEPNPKMININKMKKVKLLLLSMICYGIVNAQADTSAHKINPLKADTIVKSSDSVFISADTITIGNMIIVKGSGNRTIKMENNRNPVITVGQDSIQIGSYKVVIDENSHTRFNKGWVKGEIDGVKIYKSPKPAKNVSTNWFSFDLGYANFQDKSPTLYYLLPPSGIGADNLKLINGKSSNFNLWIVQQKVNLYKNKLNLKYGVGFEMFNFRLEQPVSFRNDLPNKMILDNISFSKNKLFAKYLTVPFQLNFKSDPKSNKSFYMSAGMSAGYLVDARNKQKSSERGKQKYDGNFNLNNWRFATIGELGVGGIRLYGSYGLTNLFEESINRIEFHPYTIGLRFSNF